MKKIITIALIAVAATLSANNAVKHTSVEPDIQSEELFCDCEVVRHGTGVLPQFTSSDIEFLKATYEKMQSEFINKGALDMAYESNPRFWKYWMHDNVIRNQDNGWGYWMAIVVCYESAEFANKFDENNLDSSTQWIRDFKQFGLDKDIAFVEDGVWCAYEY